MFCLFLQTTPPWPPEPEASSMPRSTPRLQLDWTSRARIRRTPPSSPSTSSDPLPPLLRHDRAPPLVDQIERESSIACSSAPLGPPLQGAKAQLLGAQCEQPQPLQMRPGSCFFSSLQFCPIIQRITVLQKSPSCSCINNSRIVHHIKIIYICKMLIFSSSFIICYSHPCLKCLTCCLH